ncbi:MAG: hypothetical protein WKG01_31685 [Kofleriaceae bacterium]
MRFLVFLLIAGGLAFCGSTVPLGNKTFFGHIRAIWATDEMGDLKDGVKPGIERVKKGVKAGVEAAKDGSDTEAKTDAGVDAAPVLK